MTLSVMDDLEFNTRYECAKCEQLETDLKTSKSEVADLRNLVTVMRAQTAKTATLLQKFDTTKKTMLLQKQKIETLEKQNEILRAEARTVNEQLKKQLDSTENSNNYLKAEENESLRNNIKSQQTVIEQYQVQFSNMERELEEFKKGKTDAEKMCKDLQCKMSKLSASSKELKEQKTAKQADLGEVISKLRSEIGVLKRENKRLKDNREETVNRLADKKNQDITKKLTAMTNKQTILETTIEKTIERTIQRNLKGFLETVTSPVKAAGSGVFRSPATRPRRCTKSTEGGGTSGPGKTTPAKKRSRPLGRSRNQRKPKSSSDENSELESISRPKKSVKRPVKRMLSHQPEPKKTAELLVQDSGHLSNSSTDDDVDLVGQLEKTFRIQTQAKSEPDGVLVCDPLPSTSREFNLFDQPIIEATAPTKTVGNPTESHKPQRKVPRVLNVKSIFDVMVSPAELSPLKTRQDKTNSVELVEVKSEDQKSEDQKSEEQLGTNPQPVSSSDTLVPIPVEKSCPETASSPPVHTVTVFSPKTTPKKETSGLISPPEPPDQTTPDIVPETTATIPHFQPISTETTATVPHFQPISIKNEMKKTKSEPDDPVFTLKPMSSKEARAAPIISTLGDLLSPSKVRTDSTAAASTPDVEIVGVVNVEREEQSVSASDSQTEDDLPEVSIAEPPTGVSGSRQVQITSHQITSHQITSQSTSQQPEDHPTSSANTFKPIAFVASTLQLPTPHFTHASSGNPKSRFPPISMSFVKPRASSNLLEHTGVVGPDIVQEVDLPRTSDTGVPTTSSTSTSDLTAKQENINQPSVTNDRVLSPSVHPPRIAIEATSSYIEKDTESSSKRPQETDGHPADKVSTLHVALAPRTSSAPKVKMEKSPSRRQSEVNVTLSGDSLVTPTTPTEVVVSEDVMVCAFEVDVGGVSSSQSDVDTHSDSAADVDTHVDSAADVDTHVDTADVDTHVDTADVDVCETTQQAEQPEKHFEKPKTRPRKSNDTPFVTPKRMRMRKSTSQDEQPEIITKCLRSRKISITDDSTEVPKRRRSTRTSSVSDASDSNESPAPRRSRRIRNSTSPYAVKAQQPKQSPKKKIPDTLAPEDMVIDDVLLGAEDRNIMVPNDLLELKKSIEQAQLQENQIKGVHQSAASSTDSSVNLTNISVLEAAESAGAAASPAPSVPLITLNTGKPPLDNASVITKCPNQTNGAKAVEGDNDTDDHVQVNIIPTSLSEKRKATNTTASPTVKTAPPPSCNWHATKSLDLDLTPVSRQLPHCSAVTTSNPSDGSVSSLSNNSDESYLEDCTLMIADASAMSQIVEDVTIDESEAPSTAGASSEVQVEKSDVVPTAEKEKTVKVVVPPASKWFAAKSLDLDITPVADKLPPFNEVSDHSDSEHSSKEVTTTECRKRKKTKGPDHHTSLAQIFDIFIPKEAVTALVLPRENEHLVMETSDTECQIPSAASYSSSQTSLVSVEVNLLDSLRKKTVVPTLPIDDEPLYRQTHEDYTHLVPHGTTQYLVEMFRRNLCTSAPNVPYIVETILYNHKNKALQNVDEKLIRVIRNEISIRDTSPADLQIPPIDVLVEFFFDLFTQLMSTGYSYFDPGTWMQDVLRKLFVQISSLKRSITQSLISLLSFAIKLSLKCEDLKYLRAYVINTINDMNFKYVCNLLTKCLCSYSIYLLIGEQHLCFSKDRNSIKDVNCLYLTGLEFYLRYTQLKFTPIEQLTYIHQFAVEHHLINSALDAVVVKEEFEPGVDFKNLNEQGLICIKLMLKSQGWSWFTSTVLPLIFDKLAITSEYGICRLTELITTLVTAEIISYRAAGDIPMLKEKLIPALIGLLWTAPTANIKFSFASCLVQLSPFNPSYVSTSLKNWINCIPQHFKEHCQYSEVNYMIDLIVERQDNYIKKSRTF